MNFLSLSSVKATSDGAEGLFEGYPMRIRAPGQAVSEHFAIRPEHMTMFEQAPAEGNMLKAEIGEVIYLGAETRFGLRTAGGTDLVLQMPTREVKSAFQPGRQVWAGWPANQGFFL